MPETTEARFEELERQVRRLRALVRVLAVGFVGVLTLGAASKPDELTLKTLTIVDDTGRKRIVAGTKRDGTIRFGCWGRTIFDSIDLGSRCGFDSIPTTPHSRRSRAHSPPTRPDVARRSAVRRIPPNETTP